MGNHGWSAAAPQQPQEAAGDRDLRPQQSKIKCTQLKMEQLLRNGFGVLRCWLIKLILYDSVNHGFGFHVWSESFADIQKASIHSPDSYQISLVLDVLNLDILCRLSGCYHQNRASDQFTTGNDKQQPSFSGFRIPEWWAPESLISYATKKNRSPITGRAGRIYRPR